MTPKKPVRAVGGPEHRINLACTPEEKAAVIAIQQVRKVPFLVDVVREMSLNECVAEYRKLKELFGANGTAPAEVEEPEVLQGSPSEG